MIVIGLYKNIHKEKKKEKKDEIRLHKIKYCD